MYDDEEYQRLADERSSRVDDVNLGEALTRLASSFAPQPPKVDFSNLRDAAENPVKDYIAKRLQARQMRQDEIADAAETRAQTTFDERETPEQKRRREVYEAMTKPLRSQAAKEGIQLDFDEAGNVTGKKKVFEPYRRPVVMYGPGDKAFEKDVQGLAKATASSQAMMSALQGVDDALGFPVDEAQVDGEAVVVGGKRKDLPGVSLPLVGRVSAFSGDARRLKSAIAKVFNVELKDRSGAAVTSNELQRLRDEFGSGRFNTEGELVDALKRYKAEAVRLLKSQEAAFRPEVVKTYQARGGTTSASLPKGRPAAPKAVKVRVTNGTETLEIDANDLVDAEKDGFRVVQ